MKKLLAKVLNLSAIVAHLYGYYLATEYFSKHTHYWNSISLQGYFLTLLVSIVHLLMSEAPTDNLSKSA